jgi:dihydrolipoamide dehydrogenase
MPSRTVDIAILGAGTAGLGARRAAKAQGASVLMIDPGPFGTTCARVGCMPSKLLIAAAHAANHVAEAPTFGVRPEGVTIDGPAVMQRVQRERDRFAGFVENVTDHAIAEGELLVGRAEIVSPGVLAVGDVEVHYQRLVIATGTQPFVPPPFAGLGERGITNEEVFDLPDLPESLLVVGLGVIGLELGQAMHRLGVRTTLVGIGGAIGPIEDPVVRASVATVLGDELDLHADHVLHSVEMRSDGVEVHFSDSHGADRREVFERVLLAAGRRTSLGALGLERLGIEPDANGRYVVDPGTLQLGDHPVFVAGDANLLHPLLHEAADDGRIAGANAATYPQVLVHPRRAPLGIVFSDPQMAVVGTGWRGLASCEAAVGEVDYGDQGRARVEAVNAGRVRIYAERRSGILLGAELFGPRVEHLAHLLAWAVHQRLTVEQALSMPFYHPVVEEGLRTALRDLGANLRMGVPVKCEVAEMGVGA